MMQFSLRVLGGCLHVHQPKKYYNDSFLAPSEEMPRFAFSLGKFYLPKWGGGGVATP